DLRQGRDGLQNRIDLLLVDGGDRPTAMFCCERGEGDWRERDIHLLRLLARALSEAIRRHGEHHAEQAALPDGASDGSRLLESDILLDGRLLLDGDALLAGEDFHDDDAPDGLAAS